MILPTKIDLHADVHEQVAELHAAARGVPVRPVSSRDGQGLDDLVPYLMAGRTVCLLGSSGVGKSTLLNGLLDHEHVETQATRGDGKGRHTTSHRELVPLPTGALLIDNPGMREVELSEGKEGLEEAFADISSLAEECRFSDCSQRHGAGVRRACGRPQWSARPGTPGQLPKARARATSAPKDGPRSPRRFARR